MIDPQGQAVSWIRSKESSNLPAFGTAALNDPKLRDKLEFTMGDGKALIILGEGKLCITFELFLDSSSPHNERCCNERSP